MTSRTTRRSREKAQTHQRILSSAARLVREKGLAAASVPAVMRGAGLTVGGFYAHFRSKHAMDAEVLRTSLVERSVTWFRGLDAVPGTANLARAVKRYLSPVHRDAPADRCPLPAALSELAHADEGTRRAVADALAAYARELEARTPETPGVTRRERALATLALCVGGIALARAWEGDASGDVLRACAKWALPECGHGGAPPGRGARSRAPSPPDAP